MDASGDRGGDGDQRPDITLAFTNSASNRRRYALARRDPGGWTLVEQERDAGKWRDVGRDIVADVELEISPAALATVVDVIRDRVGAVTRGP